MCRLLWPAVVYTLAWPALAGTPEKEPIRITYSAASPCPDEAAFARELLARTDRVRRAAVGDPARVFDVTVLPDDSGSLGVLRTIEISGAETHREVRGDSCAEVVSALALMAALSVDPTAHAEPEAAIPATQDAALPAPSPSSTRAFPSLAPRTAIAPLGSSRPNAEPPGSDASSRPPEQTPTSGNTWVGGAYGKAIAGLVPSVALGGGGFLEAGSSAPTAVSPSFRASILLMTAHPSFGAASAVVTWALLRLEACPVRLRATAAVRLDLCAGIEGGAMRTRGEGLDHTSIGYDPWLAGAAAFRTVWSPFGSVQLEAGAGLDLPLRRYTFVADQGHGAGLEPVDRVGVVGGSLTLGVGADLP